MHPLDWQLLQSTSLMPLTERSNVASRGGLEQALYRLRYSPAPSLA